MTIDELKDKYYTPTESVNAVYDIFKDFFNEVRVDLQINKEFKDYLEYLLEARDEDNLNEIFNYDLNSTLNTVKFKRIYTEISPFFIFVHFPDVTITNEHNDSINIKDVDIDNIAIIGDVSSNNSEEEKSDSPYSSNELDDMFKDM